MIKFYFTGLLSLFCVFSVLTQNNQIEINTTKLSMLLEWNDASAQLAALKSLPEQTVLTSPESRSLFVLKIRQQNGEKYIEHEYTSLKGWNRVKMQSHVNRHTLTFTVSELKTKSLVVAFSSCAAM